MAAVNSSSTATPPRKRLLFDSRYGWVLDEWKEPSEEALSGGRGMFCIVPLAKALVMKASESSYVETAATPSPRLNRMNFVGSSSLNVLERPDTFSPHAVQAAFSSQLHKIVSSVKRQS